MNIDVGMKLKLNAFNNEQVHATRQHFGIRWLTLAFTLFALLSLSLLVYGVHIAKEAPLDNADVNLAASQRGRSLLIYGFTHQQPVDATWKSIFLKMTSIQADLRSRQPEACDQSEAAWRQFSSLLRRSGRIDWQTALHMREASNRTVQFIQAEARHKYNYALVLFLLGVAMTLILTGIGLHSGRHVRRVERERAEAVEAVRQREVYLEGIVSVAVDGIITIDEHGVVQLFNSAAERIFGYIAMEVIGRNISLLMPEPHAFEHDDYLQPYLLTGECKIIGIGREVQGRRKDGRLIPLELGISSVRQGLSQLFVGILRDISDRKAAELALHKSRERLGLAQQVAQMGSWEYDSRTGKLFWSPELFHLLGIDPAEGEPDYASSLSCYHPDDAATVHACVQRAISEGTDYALDLRRITSNGQPTRWFHAVGKAERDGGGQVVRLFGTMTDITARKQMEATLEQHQQYLSSIISTQYDIATAGLDLDTVMNLVCERARILTGANAAVVELAEGDEMVYRSASGRLAADVGLRLKIESSLSGMSVLSGSTLYSEDTELDPRVDRAACRRLEIRSMAVVPMFHGGQTIGVLKVSAPKPHAFDEHHIHALTLMAGLIAAAIGNALAFETNQTLVRERTAALETLRASEEILQRQSQELARSNTELEQFAYVASHDLQEPLRMIASYLELLDLEYGEHLNQEGREYVAYAVEGAVRMKCLINDLLTYSRVGTQGKPMQPTDVGHILEEVLADLQILVAETGAVINAGPLPVVMADATQLRLALQNLIGNAIKFRGTESPQVTISAEIAEGQWRFMVRDNGIGINPKHAERIFVIFQRLHNREKYPGTGIGLAVCKRVVERHGGRIWVESEPGKGAAFFFTLPQR
jgi:PAS domain S-box-containing protein